ncbi:MAG: AraC family transcriptional regulator [Bacillota bacterium]|nr:AraC family transcriptional regulator [Bacillota bacterium]
MEQYFYDLSNKKTNLLLKQYIYNAGSYHFNWHKELELLVVLNGQIEVCVNGSTHILETDEMIIINPNCGHATLAQKPDSIAFVLHLDPNFLKNYYENVEFLYFDFKTTKENKYHPLFNEIRMNLSKMIRTIDKKDTESKFVFDKAFYDLLHCINTQFPPITIQSATFISNQNKLDSVDKMIQYINKNYNKKITLSKLAKETQYNSNYVSQIFKSYLGINFYDYLTRIRLREATLEIGNSNKNISEIALHHGFPDIKAFNIAFKQNFGKSPTAYRKKISDEHIKIDAHFKKIFICKSDVLVNEKLALYEYYEDRQHEEVYCGNVALCSEINNKFVIDDMSNKLKSLQLEIEKMTDYMSKITKCI